MMQQEKILKKWFLHDRWKKDSNNYEFLMIRWLHLRDRHEPIQCGRRCECEKLLVHEMRLGVVEDEHTNMA